MMNDKEVLTFEVEDVNDPLWEMIIEVLKENINGFEVAYGDGNWINFNIPKEEIKKRGLTV